MLVLRWHAVHFEALSAKWWKSSKCCLHWVHVSHALQRRTFLFQGRLSGLETRWRLWSCCRRCSRIIIVLARKRSRHRSYSHTRPRIPLSDFALSQTMHAATVSKGCSLHATHARPSLLRSMYDVVAVGSGYKHERQMRLCYSKFSSAEETHRFIEQYENWGSGLARHRLNCVCAWWIAERKTLEVVNGRCP